MIEGLQILRGLAVLCVTLYHLSHFLSYKPAAVVLDFGACGVDIFFVLSGFLMVHTTQIKQISAGNFLINRFSRIAPLYWLITFFYVFIYCFGFRPVGLIDLEYPYILKSLLFIPFKRGLFVEPIVSLGWTLNYEIYFYVLFSISLLFNNKFRGMILLNFIFLTIIISSLLIKDNFYINYYGKPIVLEFLMGAWICTILKNKLIFQAISKINYIEYLLFFVGSLIIFCVQIYYMQSGINIALDFNFGSPATWGISASLFITSLLVGKYNFSNFYFRALSYLGAISYPLYLIHPFLFHTGSKLATRIGLHDWGFNIFVVLFGVSAAGLSSHILHKAAETRLTQFTKLKLLNAQRLFKRYF